MATPRTVKAQATPAQAEQDAAPLNTLAAADKEWAPTAPEATTTPTDPGTVKVNGPTGETETAQDGTADLERQIAELRAQLAAKSGPTPGEGMVWVVGKDGAPIQGVPYAPKSWLTTAKHLLPEGAREATQQEREQLQAIETAKARPQL